MLDFLFFDEKNIVSFLNLEKLYLPLQTQSGTMCFYGTLDEWLSQRSAKPCTAVRIRQVPQ